jgi:hypothetical protein
MVVRVGLDFSLGLTEKNRQNKGSTKVRDAGSGVGRQVFVSHT